METAALVELQSPPLVELRARVNLQARPAGARAPLEETVLPVQHLLAGDPEVEAAVVLQQRMQHHLELQEVQEQRCGVRQQAVQLEQQESLAEWVRLLRQDIQPAAAGVVEEVLQQLQTPQLVETAEAMAPAGEGEVQAQMASHQGVVAMELAVL